MHRNRSWSFTSPIFRVNRNRIINNDGYVPALTELVFTPDIYMGTTDTVGVGPVSSPMLIDNALANLLFKWDLAFGLTRGVTFYWKKNNGVFTLWPRNTNNTNVSFNNGDTLTVGISHAGVTAPNTFGIRLFSNFDNQACSNILSVTILPPE
jgi:hypothetical protein